MKRRLATEGLWMGTMSLLVLTNLVLVYWMLSETLRLHERYSYSDFLFYVTFFPGMFIAPIAAGLGFFSALEFMKVGQWTRSAILAFLTGGATMCAWIAWNAFLTGGR